MTRLLWMFLALGCGGSNSEPLPVEGSDASTDATDSTVDTSADSWMAADTALDTQLAFPEAGPPFPGSWRPLPTACGGAHVWISDDPSSVEKDSWVPCASGRMGCERMHTFWTSTPGERIIPTNSIGFIDAPVVNYIRGVPKTDAFGWNAQQQIIERPDGTIVFAAAQDLAPELGGYCGGFGIPGRGGVVVPSWGPTNLTRLALFPKDALTEPPVSYDLLEGALGPHEYGSNIAYGVDRLYVEMQYSGIGVLQWPGFDRIASAKSDPIARPFDTHDGVLAAWSGEPRGLVHLGRDGSLTKLYSVPPPYTLFDVTVDRVDESFVWVESLDLETETKFVLRRAPFATRAEDFAPQTVTKFTSPAMRARVTGYLQANDGRCVLKITDTELHLVRLTDGFRWSIAPEPTDRWDFPLFVDRDSLWMTVDDRSRIGSAYASDNAIRLSLPTLGSPTIPPE